MKKFISVIMALAATLACMTAFKYAYAKGDEGLTVSAKAAYLADFNSGEVVFAKNETEQLPIASMTKIMLLNLCFEKLDEGEFALTDDIPVSQTASGMGGSQVFLEANKNYPASELIKSIIVASANDASVAMAERSGIWKTLCFQTARDCLNLRSIPAPKTWRLCLKNLFRMTNILNFQLYGRMR